LLRSPFLDRPSEPTFGVGGEGGRRRRADVNPAALLAAVLACMLSRAKAFARRGQRAARSAGTGCRAPRPGERKPRRRRAQLCICPRRLLRCADSGGAVGMWYIMLHSREHAQHLCTRSQPSQLTLLPSPCSTAFPAVRVRAREAARMPHVEIQGARRIAFTLGRSRASHVHACAPSLCACSTCTCAIPVSTRTLAAVADGRGVALESRRLASSAHRPGCTPPPLPPPSPPPLQRLRRRVSPSPPRRFGHVWAQECHARDGGLAVQYLPGGRRGQGGSSGARPCGSRNLLRGRVPLPLPGEMGPSAAHSRSAVRARARS
jgi:hypothetical protein